MSKSIKPKGRGGEICSPLRQFFKTQVPHETIYCFPFSEEQIAVNPRNVLHSLTKLKLNSETLDLVKVQDPDAVGMTVS